MNLEDLFDRSHIIDLSFFNFSNAITAAYFAGSDLRIHKVNANFKKFFPVLENISNAWLPDILVQLGLSGEMVEDFQRVLAEEGQVLIPRIDIVIDGVERTFSLLSTQTHDESFTYLNGVQGQFVDRTDEFLLRREREELLEEKIRSQELIEEKTRQLERLANRLAKYLAPQIYQSIFEDKDDKQAGFKRKNLTIFFSDIVGFTDISDGVEPERLAFVINTYLSAMSEIALQFGGTLDKFIGDAVLIFFGDPDSEGELQDAIRCTQMALAMQERIQDLQSVWRSHGISQTLQVRMGINTGYCTVGNFGSDHRLEYTALGGPVNLAARLQARAESDSIYIGESTWLLIKEYVEGTEQEPFTPKGFARPVKVYRLEKFFHERLGGGNEVDKLKHVGKHVEINIRSVEYIREAIEELRRISISIEEDLNDG
ncbi:MAG: hypothetical protein DHS20C01_36380 [marine bacterium B5-7]|nr:MAG: hypothetical protein DHS20C01_36380 [marine bacterium B5-7]